MKIVIKIPDLDYFDIKHGYADNYQRERLVESVKRSIAIPKNHGRLIDESQLLTVTECLDDGTEKCYVLYEDIENVPTILEAEVENESQDKSK